MKRTINQLRSAIRRKKKRKVTITEKRIEYWWKFINEVCFDNELNKPLEFLVIDGSAKNNDCWGYCSTDRGRSKYHPVTIAIAKQTGENFLFFISILFHEMIHQWQQQIYGHMSHSRKRFYCWEDIAKYLNIPLLTECNMEDIIEYLNNN